jgi:hypothetical protein
MENQYQMLRNLKLYTLKHVYNFRLIYNIQLVHLLVCNTQGILHVQKYIKLAYKVSRH